MSTLQSLVGLTGAAWVGFELLRALASGVRTGVRGDRLSLAVLLVSVGAGLAAARRWAALELGNAPADAWPGALGLVVMWAGIALRVWSALTLGHLFTGTVMIQPGHTLVTAGPYQYVRHPSYAGAGLALLGYGLTLGSLSSMVPLMLGMAVGFGYRIWVEERQLRAAFGDAYRDYARRTKRLVPLVF